MHQRLREEDAVERVFVVGGQFAAAQQGFGGQGQFDESPFANLLCPPLTGRGGQRQFAGTVLEGDFPKARVADMQNCFRGVMAAVAAWLKRAGSLASQMRVQESKSRFTAGRVLSGRRHLAR